MKTPARRAEKQSRVKNTPGQVVQELKPRRRGMQKVTPYRQRWDIISATILGLYQHLFLQLRETAHELSLQMTDQTEAHFCHCSLPPGHGQEQVVSRLGVRQHSQRGVAGPCRVICPRVSGL